MTSYKRKIISDSISLISVEFIIRLKGLLFLPIIITTVGLKEYGIFVQIIVNQGLMVAICSLALGMSFFRFTSKFDESNITEVSRDFWTVISISSILSIFGSAIVYILSPVISKYILGGSGLIVMRYSSILIITGVFGEQLSRFMQSRKRFKLFSIYNILYQLGPYIILSVALLIRRDLLLGVLGYTIVQGIVVLGFFIGILQKISFHLPSLNRLKEFIQYSWGLMFTFVSEGLLSKIDRYFIGYFMGPLAIGIYNIIYAVVSFLDMFTVPFRKYYDVYLPAEWDNGFTSKVKQKLKEGLLYYLSLSVAFIVGVTFYLKPTIWLILNKDVSTINNFNLLVLIVSLGILCLAISRFYDPIIKFKKLNHVKLVFQVLAVLINSLVNILLIPRYGLIGAAVATLIAYFFVMIIQSSIFRIEMDKSFYLKIIRMMIATIPIYVIFSISKIQNIFGLIINVILILIIYSCLLFVMRVVDIGRIKEIVL